MPKFGPSTAAAPWTSSRGKWATRAEEWRPLLTTQDIAERLNISLASAKRLVYTGEIRSVKVGPQMRRVEQSDLEVFIAERKSE